MPAPHLCGCVTTCGSQTRRRRVIACAARDLAREMGGDQVATVGALTLTPNLINVVAKGAVLTVDLRSTEEALLQEAEARL